MADLDKTPSVDITQPNQPVKTRQRAAKSQFFETIPVKRREKVYHVIESDLLHIATGNTMSKWAATAGWGLVSFAAATLMSIKVEGQPSEVASKLACCYVIPGCLVLAAVCFGVWYFTKSERDADLKRAMPTGEEVEI